MFAAAHCHTFLGKQVRTVGVWACAAALFFQINALSAQSGASFEASIEAREVVAGVPFELSFTLKNAEGTRFSPPSFSGFRTGGISEMRGMSIVNGRSTSSQSWIVELSATKPGTYTIGEATVQAGRQTLRSKPLTLKVLPPSASSQGNVNLPPGADDRIFVAADFDKKEVYAGEQVSWRIRLYTQLSVDGYDLIALPEFEGFFSKEKIRFDKRVEYLSLRGKKYAVRTLHEEALFPQDAGELVLGVAKVSVGIEQPGAQGFLFGPKPVTLQTQPVTLLVKPLPQPAPAAFTGGVGQYEWLVRSDTSIITTDDALTLVLELKGNGDTRRFAAPKIAVPTSCEIFEPRILEEEEYESVDEILHRKNLEYVVLPKDTGAFEINPTIAYFDPDSNRYCYLQTAPVRFQVRMGKNYQSPGTTDIANNPTITNESTPSLSERLGNWLASPVFWVLLGLSVLSMGVFFLLKKRQTAHSTPHMSSTNWNEKITQPQPVQNIPPRDAITASPVPAQVGAASPTPAALTEIAQLVEGGDPRKFYDALFKVLRNWLSVRLGLQPAQMNGPEIQTALLRHGVTPIRAQALLSVWHSCEQAIYGGQAPAEQMRPTFQMAEQVLEALGRELR